MRDYTKYKVWIDSMDSVKRVYEVTGTFPNDEKFGLTNQIRRCSVSIPSNIAEGSSRSSDKDFKRFLEIAIGSLFELKTQITIAHNLGYINVETFGEIVKDLDQISKQLNALISKIKDSI